MYRGSNTTFRVVTPLDEVVARDTASDRERLRAFLEARGLPSREPTWLIVTEIVD